MVFAVSTLDLVRPAAVIARTSDRADRGGAIADDPAEHVSISVGLNADLELAGRDRGRSSPARAGRANKIMGRPRPR